MSLAESFVSHLPAELQRDLIVRELEAILGAIVAEARRSCAGLRLADETYLRFLARRVPVDRPVDESLLQLKTSDLYLACACLEGDERALALFEAHYLPETDVAVARMRSARAAPDEVRQILYEKLIVRDGEQPPKLSLYAGRGDLRSWLRVTATRTALDLMRGEKKTAPLDDNALLDHLASPQDDQELRYLKQHYRKEFRVAFHQTLAALSSRERNVLRLQLLDGLNIDQVGAIYRVHRATVARWNQKLRDKLMSTTRRGLLQQLQVDRSELESIMRLIQSRFDVSICRHLGPTRSIDSRLASPFELDAAPLPEPDPEPEPDPDPEPESE